MLFKFICLAVFLLLSSATWAIDREDNQTKQENEQLIRIFKQIDTIPTRNIAIQDLKKLSENDNVMASAALAVIYFKARHGVKKDTALAKTLAANIFNNGLESQVEKNQIAYLQDVLGMLYYHGLGINEDYIKSVRWYRKAAEQGHADGQYSLGVMYTNGQGVEKDYKQAVKWYRKAAEQGDADGQVNLGVMYEDGQGVKRDYVKALQWYKKAKKNAYKDIDKDIKRVLSK